MNSYSGMCSFRRIFIPILLMVNVLHLSAQKYTISGTIEDRSSGERLINANIYDPVAFRGVISNNYGFYSITMPAGSVKLVCSYVGFKHLDIPLDLRKDTVVNLKLEPLTALEEVTIRGETARQALRSTQMSMTELSSQSIEKIPALLGEVDVLKALQLLPGVQSGTEGSSGLYVRGGGPDQNLILLDGVPVYNVNHLFCIFHLKLTHHFAQADPPFREADPLDVRFCA